MSADTQLGLFSGLGTSEATPLIDVATATPNSPKTAAENPAAVSESTPVSRQLTTGSADPQRKSRSLSPAHPGAEERYLSVQDVARRYAVSVQTVWRHAKQNPAFPKPIKILNGSTRWRLSDVLAFEVSRGEASQ
ncbi:helix-turn-helix transcriptional regulator [Rhizobium sp. R86522]|uniref:helix-turn-helix transcriptional regulator n=1 Tax=Rhizobium sp. R86522 TaxID=3093861 RepID=UPI00366D8958